MHPPDPQRARIQDLLSTSSSPLRHALIDLGIEAVLSQRLSVVLGHAALPDLIVQGMDRANVERIARRHVVPAVTRVQHRLATSDETLRQFLTHDAEATLRALVASGKGPRFQWLRGAVDPADLQRLIAPIVQHVLTSFVAKLPIPGLAPGSRGESSATPRPRNPGSIVGMLGKQVARGASQIAGGLGLQQVVRDFSQSAADEIRSAVLDRLRSEEGKQITERIRERVLGRILSTKATVIVDDFLRVSPAEVARIAEGAVSRTRDLTLFSDLLAGEVRAVLAEIGGRPVRDVLEEANLLEGVRALARAAVEPGVVDLVRGEAFGAWLDELLAESRA
jgi:hypothetical protein